MDELSEEELRAKVKLFKRLITRVENAKTTEDLEKKKRAYKELIEPYHFELSDDQNLKELVEKYDDAYQKKMPELEKKEKEEKAKQLAKEQQRRKKQHTEQLYPQAPITHPAEKIVPPPEGFPPNPDETLKNIEKMETISKLETELDKQISYEKKFYTWVDTILDDVTRENYIEIYGKGYSQNIENIEMKIARLQTEEEGRRDLARDAARLAQLKKDQAAENKKELARLIEQDEENKLALELARKNIIEEQEAAVKKQTNMINSGAIPMPHAPGQDHDSVPEWKLPFSNDDDDDEKPKRNLRRRARKVARQLAEKYRRWKKLKPARELPYPVQRILDEGGFRRALWRLKRDYTTHGHKTRGHKGGAGGKTRRRHKPVRKTRRRHRPIRKTRHRRKPVRKTRHRRKPIRKTRRSRR